MIQQQQYYQQRGGSNSQARIAVSCMQPAACAAVSIGASLRSPLTLSLSFGYLLFVSF
jgi:hypothetical protein